MAFGHNCCCGCVIFSDTFDNRDGNLDPDGINIPDSDRYVFAPGAGHVDVPSGKLIIDNAAEVIRFFGSGIVNVQVDVTLDADGETAEIVFGSESVKAERLSAGTIRFTCGTETWDSDGTTLDTFTLYANLFKRTRYADEFECFSPDPTDDFVRFGNSKFITCPFYKTDFGVGYSFYGLRGSAGVAFDNLIVSQATPNCENFEIGCGSVCWTMPETVSISISGAVSGRAWCGPVDIPTECTDQLYECLIQCEGTTDPDSLGRCNCTCPCWQAFKSCHCDYVNANGSCVVTCDCAGLNGEWVMNRDGPCSCNYSTTIPLTITDPGDYENGCEQAPWVDATITATLVYEYCDTETGEAYVTLYPNMPFASPTVAYWYSGVINADDYCGGGSVPLITYPEGAVQYADDILLGCPGVGCGTPSGYGCGPGDVSCTYTVGEETQEMVCTTAFELICPHAEHEPISISDAVVS